MPTVQIPPRLVSAPPAANRRTATAAPPARPRKRRLPRRLAWIAAALVAALLLWRMMQPAPMEVETARAERGSLRVTVNEDGVTRVHDRYVIAAPVAGRLLRVELEEGDAVAAGDVVARIASAPLDTRTLEGGRARVAAAEAAAREAAAGIAQLRAGLAQARRDAGRLRTLARAGALSEREAELAETDVAVRARAMSAAEARLSAAQAEVRAVRAAVTDADPGRMADGTVTLVRAPVAGRVLRVAQESETPVAAGTPLVELGDAAALEVLVDVLSSDAVRIQPGMTLLGDDWGGIGVLQGTVRSVSPAAFTKVSALGVEEQRVNVVADVPEPPPGLGAGYRVEARIVTWESRDALKVPNSALFRSRGGWAVYVVESGRAQLREVLPGYGGDAEAEVVGGLRAGEEVVLYPSDEVGDGVRVKSR
jgi:HlyD family secretion protein